jgi:hypothetical protein
MPRLLAMVALFLAVFGLALSPAAACHVNAQAVPAKAAVQSPCHDAAEAPAEPAPDKADVTACCKTMCAPALPAIATGMDDPVSSKLIVHAPRPAQLAGLIQPLDKPPPRTSA